MSLMRVDRVSLYRHLWNISRCFIWEVGRMSWRAAYSEAGAWNESRKSQKSQKSDIERTPSGFEYEIFLMADVNKFPPASSVLLTGY